MEHANTGLLDAGPLRGGDDEREPVKEGSERKATAALTRDLQCAFGAERDTTTRG